MMSTCNPYLAQGGSQDVQGAGALGILLSSFNGKLEVSVTLELYEQVRKGRADGIQLFGGKHRPQSPSTRWSGTRSL
jgi:hypothetical protein